jgi:hypothetical protein
MAWLTRPTMAAGAPLLAEDLDALLDQIELLSDREVCLQADHAGVTNSTTLVNTNLSLGVAANTKYRARCLLIHSAHTAGDLKPALSLPSGTTVNRFVLRSLLGSNDTSSGSIYMGTTTSFGGFSAPGQTTAADIIHSVMEVLFTTSSTAGNCVLQYAQFSATASAATILRANSCMRLEVVRSV